MLKCSGCKKELTDDNFYQNLHIEGSGKDNLCKVCRKAYSLNVYAKNKKRYIDQAKAWYQEHKHTEEYKEKRKQWCLKNKEKRKEYYKKWAKENRPNKT